MKMPKTINIPLLLKCLSFMIFLSCDREKLDFIGPSTISPTDGFEVQSFTASNDSVDLENNTLLINASFNQAVTWTITITGQTSGATWSRTGLSSDITNLTWYGGHSGIQFFRTGENVTITVSFMASTIQSNLTVYIEQAHEFDELGLLPTYANFEGIDESAMVHPYWVIFPPISGYDVEQGLGSAVVSYSGEVVRPNQGDQYFYMRGLGSASDPGFVSGTQCYIADAGYPSLPSDADEVWINVYVWGSGNPNARLDMELQEDDTLSVLPSYKGWDDDNYIATMRLNHYGWKLFSFKYADLETNIYENLGDKGNKKHEPHRLQNLVFILIKDQDQTMVSEAYFDYPIFTVGGPLNTDK